MRCFALFLVVLFLIPTAPAQEYATDKGSLLLAGSFGLTSYGERGGEGRSTLLSINPNISYFVIPGLALGADLGIFTFFEGGFSSTSLSVGPKLAYFFGGPTSTTRPFLASALTYGRYSGSDSVLGADVSGGALFMLTRSVGITTEAFYQTFSYSDDDSSNSFGLRGGVTVFVL